MAGWSTGNMDHLIRSEIWSSELKDVLLDDLQAQGYVRWLSEFPDGNTFTIPSIGTANVRDYYEGDSVVYDAMDTGEFQFSISEYVSSATYITNKAKQDSFYMNELVSSFVPKQRRAIEEKLETKIGSKTNKMLRKQNVPRKVITDGPPFEIYKRCGWEPPMGGSEEDELTKRRDMVAKNSSSEALEVMDRLSQEYFHEYLS